MAGYGLFQASAIHIDVVLFRKTAVVRGDVEVPVLSAAPIAGLIEFEPMARHELADSGKHGFRAGRVTEGQIFAQHAPIEFGYHAGVGEDRFYLGAEEQSPIFVAIVERLDAQPVASRKENAATLIPNHEREHAAEVLHAVATVFFVEMDDGFGVAVGAVYVAARLHFLAGVLVVVDFAVIDDPDIAGFVRQGLVTGLDVDDDETAHGDAHVAVEEKAFIIRTAVGDLAVHRGQRGPIHATRSILVEDPADATHLSTCPVSCAGKRYIPCRGGVAQWLVQDNFVAGGRYDLSRLASRDKLAIWNRSVGGDEPLSGRFHITAVAKIQIAQNPVNPAVVNEQGVAGPPVVHPRAGRSAEKKAMLLRADFVEITLNF